MNKSFWDYPLRRHHRLSQRTRDFVRPLVDSFGIHSFSYFFVNEQGDSACLSSNPEWMEFYLYNDLFLHNPFLKSPRLTPSGVVFTKSIQDPGFLESKKHAKSFGIEDSLVLTFKNDNILHGFSFGLKSADINYTLFINELPLLKRYCQEFERRAERELYELASEPINILPFLGNAFYTHTYPFCLPEEKRTDFLAQLKYSVPKLSKREKECLLLYLKGETAKGIAHTLQLSPRTVEFYLNNIKCKLNCTQKTELIQKAQELQEFGILP